MSSRGVENKLGDVGRRPSTKDALKQQVHDLIEDQDSSIPAYCISLFLLFTIVVSILCFILETVESLRELTTFWKVMDVSTTVIFSIEYLTRLWVCDIPGGVTRCKFIRTPMNILDVLAILPGFLDIVIANVEQLASLRVFRCVRLVRLFRIFKLGKYASGMNLMVAAITNSLQPLSILMFFISVAFILFSSLLYYAEKLGCPDFDDLRASGAYAEYAKECVGINGNTGSGSLCCNENGQPLKFPTILSTLWWTIVTMTTVGYGDLVPFTVGGRIVAGLAMLCGILLISLPVAIVGSKFQEAYSEYELDKQQQKTMRTSEIDRVNSAERRAESSLQLGEPDSEAQNPCSPKAEARLRKKDANLHSSSHLENLRNNVLKLRSKHGLSTQATEQIKLLLELFNHIDRVEHQIGKLHAKDMDLQRNIRCDFDSLCTEYDSIYS